MNIENKRGCKLVSTSLSEIIRYTRNEQFRTKCYEALNVESTKNLEIELLKKLSNICENGGKPNSFISSVITNNKDTESNKLKKQKITRTEQKPNWLAIATEQSRKRNLENLQEKKNKKIVNNRNQPITAYFPVCKTYKKSYLSQSTIPQCYEEISRNSVIGHSNSAPPSNVFDFQENNPLNRCHFDLFDETDFQWQ